MLITYSRSGSRLAQATKSGTLKQKPCSMLFLIPSENNKLHKERANEFSGRLTVFPDGCDFCVFFLLQVDHWLVCLCSTCVKTFDSREYTETYSVGLRGIKLVPLMKSYVLIVKVKRPD